MKLGKEAMEALKAEITGTLMPGDALVTAGAVALEGTKRLAKTEYEELRKYFSEAFLQEAGKVKEQYGVGECAETSDAWKMAEEAGAHALYACGSGGILAAMWKMAEASGVGLSVDLRKIPIRQETIELFERYDLNPYKILSQGAILIGTANGEALVQLLEKKGIPAAVIGVANDGNDRLLYSGENVRFLERPAKDEMEKRKWRRANGEIKHCTS